MKYYYYDKRFNRIYLEPECHNVINHKLDIKIREAAGDSLHNPSGNITRIQECCEDSNCHNFILSYKAVLNEVKNQ